MQHPKKPIDARLRRAADLALSVLRGKAHPLAADIGCDHGYLSAYLLRQRGDLSVVCSDISPSSLAKARLLMDPSLYGNRVRFAEADGLFALSPEEHPDVVILAGMGGQLIARILREGRERLGEAKLVLQANTDVPFLRAALSEMGWPVTSEAYAEVSGRIYAVLLAERGEAGTLTPREALLGIPSSGEGRRRYLLRERERRVTDMRQAVKRLTPKSRESLGRYREESEWIAEELGMKTLKVRDLAALVGEIAPYELAEEWDNVGLLLGHEDAAVKRALVALDVTRSVVEEAVSLSCQAIVTHHPFMFNAIRRVTDADREGMLMLSMAEAGIAHIAAHTNLDAAPGGVNDTLIALMGAEHIRGEGFVRVGDLAPGSTLGQIAERAREALSAQVRVYGETSRRVHVLGCCSGAGAGEYRDAMALGADCFITGEVRHNLALDALHDGVCMIEAGHWETERPVCPVLCDALQKAADAIEYDVVFFCSQKDALERG